MWFKQKIKTKWSFMKIIKILLKNETKNEEEKLINKKKQIKIKKNEKYKWKKWKTYILRLNCHNKASISDLIVLRP